jgi:hypothetical protein
MTGLGHSLQPTVCRTPPRQVARAGGRAPLFEEAVDVEEAGLGLMLWTGPIDFEPAAQMGSGARSGTRRARGFRVDARHVTWASWPSAWNTTVCRASTGS